MAIVRPRMKWNVILGMLFRCLGFMGLRISVWGCMRLVVGFNFGFGRTKTTRNVRWGSILTASRKNAH